METKIFVSNLKNSPFSGPFRFTNENFDSFLTKQIEKKNSPRFCLMLAYKSFPKPKTSPMCRLLTCCPAWNSIAFYNPHYKLNTIYCQPFLRLPKNLQHILFLPFQECAASFVLTPLIHFEISLFIAAFCQNITLVEQHLWRTYNVEAL